MTIPSADLGNQDAPERTDKAWAYKGEAEAGKLTPFPAVATDDEVDAAGGETAATPQFFVDPRGAYRIAARLARSLMDAIGRLPTSADLAGVNRTLQAEIDARRHEDGILAGDIAANKERIDSLGVMDVFAARLTVWPPNVAMHSDVQRNFKAVLNELNEQILRLDGGGTGTQFVNRFQIKTRNADRAEVLLHSEGWSYTAEGAQELEWNVDAAEFNQLGTELATDYIEVWGEFRALYGGGVDELRGRTQPFVIGFGDEGDWPSTRGDVQEARTEEAKIRDGGDTMTTRPVSKAAELAAKLLAHEGSNVSSVFHVTADFATATRAYVAGQRWYLPRHHDAEAEFVLLSEGATLTQKQQIGLLSFTTRPASISYRSQAQLEKRVKEFTVSVANPELLTGDVWIEGVVQGQRGLERTKWGPRTNTLSLQFTDIIASAIAGNIDADETQFEMALAFYDAAGAGNLIEQVTLTLPIEHGAPVTQVLAAAAAIEWDVDEGDVATLTATRNFTLSLTGGDNGQFAILRVLQDATGNRIMTLAPAIVLDGRDAPVLSAAAGAHDNLLFMKRGAVWVFLGAILNG